MPADNVKSLYIFLKAVKRKLLLLARYLTVYKVAAKARDYIAMETKQTNKQTNKSNERQESERGVARKGFLILLINFYFLSI